MKNLLFKYVFNTNDWKSFLRLSFVLVVSISNIFAQEDLPYFLEVQNARIERINNGEIISPDEPEMNNIVVFITFADATDFDEPASYYLNLFNDNPNSVKSYYQTISKGEFTIENHLFPVQTGSFIVGHQLEYDRQYYIWNPEDLNTEVIEYLDHIVPENLDLDKNNDGKVDCITVIQQGIRGAFGGPFWPITTSITGSINNIQTAKSIVLQDEKLDPDLVAHEMGHVLGLPDFYDPSFSNTFVPIGDWDIMANHNAFAGMSGFSLYVIGFLDNIPEITEPGTYSINELFSSNEAIAYRIASGKPNEYFILEYRRQESGNYFDANLPGSGLLIYKIGGENRYKYYLHRSGGIDDEITNGDLSKAFFSIESGRTSFDANSSTKPILSDGSLANFNISEIGSASGNSISFRYDRVTCPVFTEDELFFSTGTPVPNEVNAFSLVEFDGFFNYDQGDEKTIISNKVIKWNPGFCAFEGSKIIAKISSCEAFSPIPPLRRELFQPESDDNQGNDYYPFEDNHETSSISTYPNPSNGKIEINLHNIDLTNSTLSVTDISGNLILNRDLKNKSISIDLSDYDNGLYMISVNYSKGNLTNLVEIIH